jgi:hypothetical protein
MAHPEDRPTRRELFRRAALLAAAAAAGRGGLRRAAAVSGEAPAASGKGHASPLEDCSAAVSAERLER